MGRVTLNEYRITFTLILTVIILLANWLISDVVVSTIMNILMFMYMSFYYGTAAFKAGRMERIRKEVSFFSDSFRGKGSEPYNKILEDLSQRFKDGVTTDKDYIRCMITIIDSWRMQNPGRDLNDLFIEMENNVEQIINDIYEGYPKI